MKILLIDKINIVYNYFSFFIIGISGIALNVFILKVYDTSILGNFNLLLSLLVIGSQITVLGLHMSVLKHNSYFKHKITEVSKSVISALVLCLIINIILLSMIYIILLAFENILFKHNLIEEIYLILPAFVFFSLNKILLMSFNGLNYMKTYAFFNTLRYILLVSCTVCFYFLGFEKEKLAIVFSFSEFFLFISLFIYKFTYILKLIWPKQYWIKRHFFFGSKGFLGGALMEINTRIDILMIGFFLGTSAVGIYSFASMIAEGFIQLYVILKNNIDPIIGKAFFKKEIKEIKDFISTIKRKVFLYFFFLGIISILFYKIVFFNILGVDELIINKSWDIFIILMFFIILSSFYKPFFGVLNQINKPKLFSKIITLGVVSNILLNYFFIKLFGIYGAALSTGLIFFLQSYFLYFFAINTLSQQKDKN